MTVTEYEPERVRESLREPERETKREPEKDLSMSLTTDTVTIHDQNKRCKLNPELEESVCERAVKSAMNRLVEMKIKEKV